MALVHTKSAQVGRAARRGFTLMELLLTIGVIFLLMGLLIVGVKHAMRSSKGAIDRASVTALKNAVTSFKDQFGFLPPLVKDGGPQTLNVGPLTNNRSAPLVYSLSTPADVTILKTTAPFVSLIDPDAPSQAPQLPTTTDIRFSVYSLPYYLMGVLDIHRPNSNIAIDGVDGPRFKAVKRDGTFETSGRDFNPFFDPRNGRAVFETEPGTGKIQLRDAHGVPIRYYRWARGNQNNQVLTAEDCNIPELVALPDKNPEARAATYGIVSAGPNGVFGDEAILGQMFPGHPLALSWQDLGAKVGISCDNSSPDETKIKVVKAAYSDNVVEYGHE